MTTPEAKLVCRNVWKLFGADASGFLTAHDGQPETDAITRAGLVGAVRRVDLDVREGEIFVIMGLSGSGKSTLVRLMSRLIEPTGGDVLFKGENLLKVSQARMIEIRRHQMGMVFQHFALLPHLTVLDNVAFPLDIQGMSRAAREARAREMIELVGLAGKESAFPRQLSGGQQQRVGIARSLAVEPEIWFLDEPFSALDPLIRREMQDEFLRLQDMLGKTIVFITHDFDEALRLADRIAIMKDGAIEQCDTPDQIVLNPQTAYVRKFTEDIDKARVVHAGVLAAPVNGQAPEGEPVQGDMTILQLARQLVNDTRDHLPVTGKDGTLMGVLERRKALDVLLGDQ